MQDIAIVPMIIILSLFDEKGVNTSDLILQIFGGILILVSVVWITYKKEIEWKWVESISKDRELQVFASLSICTGFALLTGLMQLSTALGAFVAGLLVSRIRETAWVGDSLDSLRVLFVALFFSSIGMLIDLRFISTHVFEIAFLVMAVFMTNFFINALILKSFGYKWRASLYAGSLLSQIGEFSFILATIGLNSHIIIERSYQMTISIIAITLLISPFLIFCVRLLVGFKDTDFSEKPTKAKN
ncbi:MAG: CPA2 family monovalent cation:H+ antiporter-2 [Alphaproteobacteria bacterium]